MQEMYERSATDQGATAGDDVVQPIAILNVGPLARQNFSLGNFSPASPPTGFAVQPGIDDHAGSVVTELISQGTDSSYELILRVVNHGARTESIKVWQM